MTLAGDHVRTIGAGVIDGWVIGIAASADMIAVGTYSGKVFKFDMASGVLIRSFGTLGSAEGQLKHPVGLRFTPDGRDFLIAEAGNSRLSMFTLSGAFVHCIGVGALNSPFDVDFAANGDILVADKHGMCVLSFDGSTLLRSFGPKGEAPGKLSNACAVAVCCDKLFVLDSDTARVQVFN